MEPLERLLAIEEIGRLKARYFRLLDTRQWGELETLFAADAVFDMREAAGGGSDERALVVGASAIAAFVRGAVDGLVTVHHGHMPEIELLAPTRARATWAMEDLLRWPGEAGIARTLRGYGHYRDTYTRIEGRWVIQSSALSRLLVDFSPV
ncbi:nuclear transport factor 2 family protein [Pseudoduganella namucuonensis]|uniref:SnoaL-like domain-containing protein n=1 Tax=Pseudoduganella namucuonensis TaxID=1035707 RepID=A0A1I7LSD0_9BURK|nr:nuclear transport factor 2 family protein [Pseudoduganella namucuonensis]SFV12538.1 SnoaL-like domain-containing protein [Pseudoduganella namucuonensis]